MDSSPLLVTVVPPVFIVGRNVDDIDPSITNYHVGNGTGTIAGSVVNDVLVGDVGGSLVIDQTQDYNFAFILDVSGSMGSNTNASSELSLMVDAVSGLLNDLAGYNSGEVQIYIVPFSTTAKVGASFTVTDTQGLADAIAFLDGLDGSGYTNY